MHVRNIRLRQFKFFKDLQIGLDGTPRLVVLCGPNGSGKSSVIDGIATWRLQRWGLSDPSFFTRGGDPNQTNAQSSLGFHEPKPTDPKSAVYVRTAQRVTVDFQSGNLNKRSVKDPAEIKGPARSDLTP